MPESELLHAYNAVENMVGAGRGDRSGSLSVDGPQSPGRGGASWPLPLQEAAYHSLPGAIVHTLEPYTEADPAAILVQLLAAFGNVIGRRPHFAVEADIHRLVLFVALVGATAKGRKGTSWGYVRRLFARVDALWEQRHIMSGLSSGEGLIYHVRDPLETDEPVREKQHVVRHERHVVDSGVEDKRLLVLQPELASVLRVMGRDGNTLSAVLREAWDGNTLGSLTKNSPLRATGAHVSLVGHITVDELNRYLSDTETANGFANRFHWFCVQRSRCLPEGGQVDEQGIAGFIAELGQAVSFAQGVDLIKRDAAARDLWISVYPELSEGRRGLLGAVTSRAEAQVTRLACLYALLDFSRLVQEPHLRAALEVWRFSNDSCRYIFGSALGDPIVDKILDALNGRPAGMTRTEIRDLFKRHVPVEQIDRALQSLAHQGLARPQNEETGGRPTERWLKIPGMHHDG